jgi:hypothetical protein
VYGSIRPGSRLSFGLVDGSQVPSTPAQEGQETSYRRRQRRDRRARRARQGPSILSPSLATFVFPPIIILKLLPLPSCSPTGLPLALGDARRQRDPYLLRHRLQETERAHPIVLARRFVLKVQQEQEEGRAAISEEASS